MERVYNKLSEEIDEFTEDESIEELCDGLEVIDALKKFYAFRTKRSAK